ncbi:hypothetical protein GWI33_013386 [Rhynchophorus ferrugineus]|uniref:Uncharacterized protein n=1 Tax=Rhynchophorus ferrugineus TaxID=354439 RepID=A0A834I9R2_RHYFE|nr:hypothetical protein GWI33_013386 [Rhynchophorus ferrugineus]
MDLKSIGLCPHRNVAGEGPSKSDGIALASPAVCFGQSSGALIDVSSPDRWGDKKIIQCLNVLKTPNHNNHRVTTPSLSLS